MKTIFLVLLLLGLALSFEKKDIESEGRDYKQIVTEIRDRVKNTNGPYYHQAWERLAYLVDTYGNRLWGSESLELVLQDLYNQAQDLNFDNIYKDPVTNFTKWVRGEESLTLYDPRPSPQKITMIGLGESVSGDVKAEAIVVTSFDDLELKKNMVKGKIVVYAMEWVDYGTTVAYRSMGPWRASQYGAVGCVIRSVTPFSIDSPHTGDTSYNSNFPKIPAAAVSVADAKMFLRMFQRGQKIVLHLKMENQFVPGANSYNLIAEIKGTEKPEEIVIFGGHIDSWDTGSQTGANDDGGGFATCFEALRVVFQMGLRPRRTMRFIAWSGEEYGGSSSGAAQYLNQHIDEIENHVLVFESDEGSTTPYGFGFSGTNEARDMIDNILENYMTPINCTATDYDGVMVDSGYLYEKGVPAMRNLIWDFDEQTHPYYFTYHHSAGDTMDVLNPDAMDDNVIAIASMMFIVADMEKRLPFDNN